MDLAEAVTEQLLDAEQLEWRDANTADQSYGSAQGPNYVVECQFHVKYDETKNYIKLFIAIQEL